MTSFNRREFLSFSVAMGAAAAASPLARAAPSFAAGELEQAQAHGFYRYKELECAWLSDGARTFALPDWFVGNAPKSEALAAAEAAYMPPRMVTIPFNTQLIATGGELVLIDSGNGPAAFSATKGAVGRASKNLGAVIISHLHPAHTNGLELADGSLAFPNAEIIAPTKDWEFWMSEENAAKGQSSELTRNYFANVKKTFAGLETRVTRYDWDKELVPGVSSIAAAGHTPGHTAFVFASGSSKVLIQSDVTNIPELFLRNPDWHVAYDNDPDQAQATRHRFYDMAAAEKAVTIGYHFSFPSIGHVEKAGAGYRLVPIAWSVAL
jgi:glyoxylase-like metal-dependent hydrolase (beta-lactamase superfamily II)